MNEAAPFTTELFKPAKSRTKEQRFKLVAFDQIQLVGGQPYLVKGLIPASGLIVIWGPPKCGKSFLAFDMAMHVALGWEYRGRKVRAGPVVYCALEGANGFRARVEAFRREKMMGPPAETPFHLMPSSLSLVADCAAFVSSIREQLAEACPVAVVIDTLNRSLAGSESDDKDMAAYVRAADAIREAFDCAVIIVHHCGHNGERPRGHSSLIGAVDAQIAVKREGTDNIVATLELAKDMPADSEFVSRLISVEVGTDEDGDPITSCVIEAVDGVAGSKPIKPSARLPKGAQVALRALKVAIEEVGSIPPASNHIPAKAKAVTIEQWRDFAYRMGLCSSSDTRAMRQAFQRASEALLAASEIAVWEPCVWLAR